MGILPVDLATFYTSLLISYSILFTHFFEVPPDLTLLSFFKIMVVPLLLVFPCFLLAGVLTHLPRPLVRKIVETFFPTHGWISDIISDYHFGRSSALLEKLEEASPRQLQLLLSKTNARTELLSNPSKEYRLAALKLLVAPRSTTDPQTSCESRK